MKRIFDYLQLSLLVAALALMTACGGDGGTDEPEKPQTPTELIVSPSTFTFGAEGGQQDVTIEAPASWSVSAGAWCNLNPKQGSKGKTVAKLVVPANTGKER